jgi:hypothetical protein
MRETIELFRFKSKTIASNFILKIENKNDKRYSISSLNHNFKKNRENVSIIFAKATFLKRIWYFRVGENLQLKKQGQNFNLLQSAIAHGALEAELMVELLVSLNFLHRIDSLLA